MAGTVEDIGIDGDLVDAGLDFLGSMDAELVAGWSAGGGLALRDVKAVNIDGSRNDCVQCCAKAPPFELSADGGKTWLRVQAERMCSPSTTTSWP